MAQDKLSPAEIQAFLETLAKDDGVLSADYGASKDLKADDARSVQQILEDQIPEQRKTLLRLVIGLTVASFVLLAFIVIFQMLWQIRHPEYRGVSDTVINVLSVGVFAELVGVVGVIVKLVWKNQHG